MDRKHWNILLIVQTYHPVTFMCLVHSRKLLEGENLNDDNRVEVYVRYWLQTRPTLFYANEILKLSSHWKKCISKAGEYIE